MAFQPSPPGWFLTFPFRFLQCIPGYCRIFLVYCKMAIVMFSFAVAEFLYPFHSHAMRQDYEDKQ
jgi:hypothetical protein